VFDSRAGVLAALITAISPYQLAHAQSARMYALLFLLTATATWALLGWLDEGGRRWAVGYVGAATLLGYTHVYGLLILAAHGLYGLVRVSRGVDTRRWLTTNLSIGLLLSPYAAALLWQLTAGDTSGIGWIDPPGVFDIPVALLTVAVGLPVTLPQVVSVAALGVGVCAALARREGQGIGALAAVLLVPVLLAFALSILVRPILAPRYLVASAVGIYTLAAGGLLALVDTVETPHIRRAGRVALVGWLALALLGSCAVFFVTPPIEEWQPAIEHVEDIDDDQTAVILTDAYVERPVDYYAGDLGTPLDDHAGVGAVRQATDGHRRLVVVKSNAADTILRSVERAGWDRVNHSEFVGVDVLQYARQEPGGET
jgi:hypothetical protein